MSGPLKSGYTAMDLKALVQIAEAGDQGAQYRLGFLYCVGDGVEKNLQNAAVWWIRAGRQGNEEAQFCLFHYCHFLNGCEPPMPENVMAYWNERAELGDAIFQCALGTLYAEGKYAEQDFLRSATWYKKALDQQHPDALGEIFALCGRVVSKRPDPKNLGGIAAILGIGPASRSGVAVPVASPA